MTTTPTKKTQEKKNRPPTPVFFENYAPPKKAKKGLGSKKRFASNPRADKPVNLLISILHAHEKKDPKAKKTKDKLKDKSKKGGKPVGKLQLSKKSMRSSKMSSMSKTSLGVSAISGSKQSPRFD